MHFRLGEGKGCKIVPGTLPLIRRVAQVQRTRLSTVPQNATGLVVDEACRPSKCISMASVAFFVSIISEGQFEFLLRDVSLWRWGST